MGRKSSFEVQCGRCPRVEHKDTPEPVSFKAKLGDDQEVVFEDLCSACEGVIAAALEQIGKPLQKASRGADGK